MTNKKFTDEEIIQQLERCVKRGNRNYDTDIVFDLINRQKAEIESTKAKIKICAEVIERQDKEIKELKEKYAVDLAQMESEYYYIEVEAYKEFAERLKNKIINTPFGIDCTGETDEYRDGCLRGLVAKQHNVIDMVDNLLKEMVGEEE